MKNSGSFRLVNLKPKILISYQDLQAIRHIVDIAPQEAQWFHRVQRIVQDSTVYYRIYEMYIPKQICSVAEVESDPMMMLDFYKELKEKHGNEKTNEIMQNMTTWCHSHHNMGVSPSGQDIKQFSEQCQNALDAKVDTPQIMMIFNKKDSFYSKIYDPLYGLIFEHVPFEIESFDFSWINEAAKAKFQKPKRKTSFTKKTFFKNSDAKSTTPKWNTWEEPSELDLYIKDSLTSLEDTKVYELFSKHYRVKNKNKNLKRFLRSHIDADFIRILNEAITYEVDILSQMSLMTLDATVSLDDVYDLFFENLYTEQLTKEEILAAVVFSSHFYQAQQEALSESALTNIINHFTTAFTMDTYLEYNASDFKWSF